MIDYPQKGSHYAHKTFRLMHKAMVAADYGRDVFCLLSIILHTEDAARYRGPVSYYNTQLMETLGFKKWEQFNAVRAKAIDSGWLQYGGCGKRTPGKYFVTIPEGFEQVDDGLMEECISPENGYKHGYNVGYKVGYDAGVNQGIKWGTMSAQTGGQTGGSSYPIPIPSPEPIPSPVISCSELSQAAEPVDESIVFDLVGKTPGPWHPPLALLAQLQECYPALYVLDEVRRAAAWHACNRSSRKTRSGILKFLNNWLSKSNDRGPPARRSSHLSDGEQKDIIKTWRHRD